MSLKKEKIENIEVEECRWANKKRQIGTTGEMNETIVGIVAIKGEGYSI